MEPLCEPTYFQSYLDAGTPLHYRYDCTKTARLLAKNAWRFTQPNMKGYVIVTPPSFLLLPGRHRHGREHFLIPR